VCHLSVHFRFSPLVVPLPSGQIRHQANSSLLSCSLFHFLLRAIPQWTWFSPKPSFFPTRAGPSSHVLFIFASNALVLFLHATSPAPEAGEAARGYLHGGVFIDFVGERGPVSQVKLALLDCLVWILQLIVMVVVADRGKLKSAIEGPVWAGAGPRSGEVEREESTRQDLDAEEQGRRRSLEMMEGEEGIEMQPLRDEEERTPWRTYHHLDTFYTGQYAIIDIHLVDAIRHGWRRNR